MKKALFTISTVLHVANWFEACFTLELLFKMNTSSVWFLATKAVDTFNSVIRQQSHACFSHVEKMGHFHENAICSVLSLILMLFSRL